MLVLPIKKKWFDMIKSGEKKEEYREIKPYYNNRFYKTIYKDGKIIIQTPQIIILRNGYRYDSPQIMCRIEITDGYGKKEWGAEKNKKYHILKILEILEVRDGSK